MDATLIVYNRTPHIISSLETKSASHKSDAIVTWSNHFFFNWWNQIRAKYTRRDNTKNERKVVYIQMCCVCVRECIFCFCIALGSNCCIGKEFSFKITHQKKKKPNNKTYMKKSSSLHISFMKEFRRCRFWLLPYLITTPLIDNTVYAAAKLWCVCNLIWLCVRHELICPYSVRYIYGTKTKK